MPYLSALEVCSRQGAIQIHIFLTLDECVVSFDIENRCCPSWFIFMPAVYIQGILGKFKYEGHRVKFTGAK